MSFISDSEASILTHSVKKEYKPVALLASKKRAMKDFLKLLVFLIHFLVFTLVLTACFAGLYGLVHFADPAYRNNRALLKEHAVNWALTMTGYTFLAMVGFVVLSLIFTDAVFDFLDLHMEGLVLTTLFLAGTLCIGFISGFFTLLED